MSITLSGTTGINSPTTQLAGSVSGTVTLTGAANAGTWTFTMPTTAGTNGYVLQTDGSGVTSWVASTGGGNVSNSGTPTANQIAVWTNSNTIKGVTNLPVTNLNSGTGASSTTFWRGDGTWATPAGGGGGGISWQSVQTASFTAVSGNGYPVNTTSGAITVTLPAGPSAGSIVQLTDYAGTWATNNVTIAPNGSNINGGSSNNILLNKRESVSLVYVDATQGWVFYSGFNTSAYQANYLIVAGGGGGGRYYSGGGGAGGILSGVSSLVFGTIYSVTVGAGGPGNTSGVAGPGSQGSSSVFTSLTAIGGGFGNGNSSGTNNGGSGGSGGGAGGFGSGGTGGSGTSGQGNAGGSGNGSGGGGGGGAGAVGGNYPGSLGAGGIGLASSITGSSVYYGGGGGGSYDAAQGLGGNGGGGLGATNTIVAGSGSPNTGGGGGGGSYLNSTANYGGNGGSGVVILSIPTSNYTGVTTGSPTVTTSGSNTIIKFTASGSYTA